MSMMGSVPVGGGGLSFEDVIGLLKDEQAYQAKLRELQKRTEEARANLTQAVEISRKTEESKKLVQGMLDQTTQQVIEANKTKAEADKISAAAAQHEKDLAMQHENWSKVTAEQAVRDTQQLHDAFAIREKEVSAKEQKLLADLKVFEDRKADEIAVETAFAAAKQETEAKLAQREAAVREGEAKLIANLEEVQATRITLKEKLDKIKSITAG
jgi:hypothetical protein